MTDVICVGGLGHKSREGIFRRLHRGQGLTLIPTPTLPNYHAITQPRQSINHVRSSTTTTVDVSIIKQSRYDDSIYHIYIKLTNDSLSP